MNLRKTIKKKFRIHKGKAWKAQLQRYKSFCEETHKAAGMWEESVKLLRKRFEQEWNYYVDKIASDVYCKLQHIDRSQKTMWGILKAK